jgi:hypothetical protein
MGGRRLNYGPRFRTFGAVGGKIGAQPSPKRAPPRFMRTEVLWRLQASAARMHAYNDAHRKPKWSLDEQTLRRNLELLMEIRESGDAGYDRVAINNAIRRTVKLLEQFS